MYERDVSRWKFDVLYGVRPIRLPYVYLNIDDRIRARKKVRDAGRVGIDRLFGIAGMYERAGSVGAANHFFRRCCRLNRNERRKMKRRRERAERRTARRAGFRTVGALRAWLDAMASMMELDE